MIITHAAFRFIPVPAGFEREMIPDQIAATRRSLARRRRRPHHPQTPRGDEGEARPKRLEALKSRRDDMVTLEEIGIDQIIVDEAQEFRKLSFATNRTI